MRKVLHVIDSSGPGGAETIFLELASRLDAGAWPAMAAVPRAGWVLSALEERGVQARIVPSEGPFNLRYLGALVDLVRRHRIELIQTHLFGAALYGSLAGAITGLPVVRTLHGAPDLDAGARGIWARYRALRLARGPVVCVSRALRADFHARAPFPKGRSMVIYNGIDLQTFRTGSQGTVRAGLGAGAEHLLVGTVANFRPAKALDIFIQMAAILAAGDPRFRFVIVGQEEETMLRALTTLRAELGVERIVRFAGFRADVAEVIRSFDFFVSSSHAEGFSLTTVQAMASGVPVVATRSGGPEEIIRDGVDGLLIERGSPERLAEAVQSLAQGRVPVLELRRNACNRAREAFSIEAMVGAYEDLYRTLLREPPRVGAAGSRT